MVVARAFRVTRSHVALIEAGISSVGLKAQVNVGYSLLLCIYIDFYVFY